MGKRIGRNRNRKNEGRGGREENNEEEEGEKKQWIGGR